MTLVIATGGVDLSVGAIMAICGLGGRRDDESRHYRPQTAAGPDEIHQRSQFYIRPLWQVSPGDADCSHYLPVCGNGLLVAYGRIQAMVATLILMIAGRGIAQLITNGVRIQIFYEPYAFIGQGWIVLPFLCISWPPVFAIAWILTRKTAIGMFIESVASTFAPVFQRH